MAIRGVSLSEKEPFISKDDPAHEDNIKASFDKQLAEAERGRKTPLTADQRGELHDKVTTYAGKPTIFFLGNLTKADRVEIADMTTTPTMHGQSISLNAQRTKRSYELVQRGLVGWENMYDSEGNIAPWKEGTVRSGSGFKAAVHEDCIAILSHDLILELADAILEKNGMTSALEKNFAGASQPSAGNLFQAGDAPTAQTTKNEKEVANEEPKSPSDA